MKFVICTPAEAEADIALRLAHELEAEKRVVWLVSGGSNIHLEVSIMNQLRGRRELQLENLTILPMDERYGRPGHANSNIAQLQKNGFVAGAVDLIDILAHDVYFEETLSYYDDAVSEALALAHVVVGQFGLGQDGHIAGILPASPACDEDYATVTGYEWDDYVRLTLSPRALSEVSVAYVAAFGASKTLALQRLRQADEPLDALPARLLYEIPEVYVYNDTIESEGGAP